MRDSLSDALTTWLQRRQDEMYGLLEAAVNIDSGSYDKAGVDRVGDLLRTQLERAGITMRRHVMDGYGNCLSADIPAAGAGDGGHVLLLGHMDTVFPTGTAARRPFRVEGNTAYGPGVADMKSGLVMNLFVLRAFAELGGNRAPLRLLFTGDEEVASPASRELIMQMARGARAVFNAEPARPTGNLVTGRKGAFFIDFEVDGVAAHAGVNHNKGASAVEALARKIVDLHRLTDYGTGVTANVGTVNGGTSVNTVAEHAVGQLDVRFPAGVDPQQLHARILEIIERQSPACTCGRIKRQGTFLPLAPSPANERLLSLYQHAAQSLGFEVQGEFTGGSADSGLTASVGAPTLCATGPVGGNPHTDREFCRIDTLVPRAQALALSLLSVCAD